MLKAALASDKNLKLINIKTPLHLALAVSPLYLLVPTNLGGSSTYGRKKMLQVCILISNLAKALS